MGAVTAYLRNGGRAILLCDVVLLDGTRLYWSDGPYCTEPGDSPGSQPYDPVIGGLPRLSQEIQELRGGRARGSYGDLELIGPTIRVGVVDTDPLTVALRGAEVSLYLAAPRSALGYTTRVPLWRGYLGAGRGTVAGTLSLALLDRRVLFDGIRITLSRYDAAMEAPGFPAESDGKPKPLALGGMVTNVAPVLVDAANLVYQHSDPALGNATGANVVYDGGIPVARTTLTGNRFQLAAAPASQVTATYLFGWGLYPAVPWQETDALALACTLAVHWGGLAVADVIAESYPGGEPSPWGGLYLSQDVSLSDTLTDLCANELAWWGWRRDGKFTLRKLLMPTGSPGLSIGAADLLGDPEWADEDEICHSVEIRWYRNWTPLAPVSGVAADRAEYLRSEGRTYLATDPAIRAAYPYSVAGEPLATLRAQPASPPVDLGERFLSLFGGPRRRVTVRVPVWLSCDQDLWQVVALNGLGALDGSYRLVGIEEESGSDGLAATLTLWGPAYGQPGV